MSDYYADELPVEAPFGSPGVQAPGAGRDLKFSWPAFETTRELFDRRDDSVGKRKYCRHLDTFREVPPDDRDIQRLAERFGARYIMLPFCIGGVQQSGKTIWREVLPDARAIGNTPGVQYAPPQPAQPYAPQYVPAPNYSHAPGRVRARAPRRERLPRHLRREARGESEAIRILREAQERERQMMEEARQRDREHQEELRRLERESFNERLDRIEQAKGNPAADADPETVALLEVTKSPAMRRRIAESLTNLVGEGGEGDWKMELMREAFENADKMPLIGVGLGNLIGGILGRTPAVVQQPQPQQQAQPEQQQQAADGGGDDAPLTFPVLLNNLKTDIVEGNSPRQSIADVLTFRVENPQYAPQIDQLLAATPDELLLILSQATGADLTQLANARRFVEKVQAGVKARLQPAQPAEASLNGNGAHAAAQAG
jgi:flagellar basal body-associated protein FliL